MDERPEHIVTGEKLISLEQARHLMPHKPSLVTVWRWARYGVVARSGEVVKLEHVRLGGNQPWFRPASVLKPIENIGLFGRAYSYPDKPHFPPPSDSVTSGDKNGH
jgi:hypothetical protein